MIKSHYWFLTCAAVGGLTISSVLAAEPDLTKVNPLMQEIANEVLSTDDLMSSAEVVFDPQATSFQRESLGYSVKASMAKSPWGGPTSIVARTDFQTIRETPKYGVQATLNATSTTDVVALIRHAGTVALNKSRGYDPRYAARFTAMLNRAKNAQSIEESATIIKDGQTLALEYIEQKIADARIQVDCVYQLKCGSPKPDFNGTLAPDYTAATRGELDVKEWLRLKDAYRGTLANFDNGTITVDCLVPAAFFGHSNSYMLVDPQMGRFTFSATTVTGRIESFFGLKPLDLDKAKEDLRRALSGVEAGSVTDREDVAAAYRVALMDFKRVIRGDTDF